MQMIRYSSCTAAKLYSLYKAISKAFLCQTRCLFERMFSVRTLEGPYFCFAMACLQLLFLLLMYQRSSSSWSGAFMEKLPDKWDYSKLHDVYFNLSFFSPASTEDLHYCPPKSPLLVGPIKVNFHNVPNMKRIIRKNPYVQRGGLYTPRHCVAQYKTAILVPHRNRETHLRQLLYFLHPFLQRQQLHYRIYVINQAGNGTFNRAKLLNIGVREALKDDEWDCLFLHDVDLIPENDYNLYVCDELCPKHVSSAMNKFNYRLPYRNFFGGVTAVTPEQYLRMNGFPNSYWGWGGEDDEIANRVHYAGMNIVRVPLDIGRYKMIKHGPDEGNNANEKRFDMLTKSYKYWKVDGMNSLEYKCISKQLTSLYTNITADIGEAPIEDKNSAPES
ncbi:beta-1,4-galactosyltransferase 3-like isoform X1 [Polypterus senegalus]|uniref:beta-1,4-galactosyltransferase 3-like isoform X1 n=1 Tax=Polypterus senegalus TaxID=55291 RepID=UPI001964F3A3|nr:beta-1,4-galactosyltransferase 3-like isoform X1 [Polypterus senegalus]XP_039600010.1 beta-1,4-galactosyltransferase 3-like isoform X1 [Polypterus senegalus]XP_039600011.1 beta-1,4-galactosyltransferase 3-like isoform X1 [Polypterus senegalus]